MKKSIYILSIIALLAQSCQEEDSLVPSLADVNRAIEMTDQSKPVVKRLVDDFNCGLLYEYDENIDFRYTAEGIGQTQKWNSVKFPSIKNERFTDREGNPVESFEQILNFPNETLTVSTYEEHVDAALNFLDTTLFAYFEPNSFIAGKFPRKVLVSAKLIAGKETGVTALIESDSRIASSTANRALRSVYNDNSIVINCSMKDIAPSYEKYKKDNFYVFIVRMMEMHNLYKEFPDSLFTTKEALYGTNVGVLADTWPASSIFTRLSNQWFLEQGFFDCKNFPIQRGTYSRNEDNLYDLPATNMSVASMGSRRTIFMTHHFIDNRQEDIRCFLNEMIHRTAEGGSYEIGFDNLPEPLKSNLKVMVDIVESWGINIRAFNPDLESLYTES